MVGEAVCCEESVLDVQEDWGFNKPCKDIPAGFATVLPEDYVEWSEECDERGRMMAVKKKSAATSTKTAVLKANIPLKSGKAVLKNVAGLKQ